MNFRNNNPTISNYMVDPTWIGVDQGNLKNCAKVNDCTKYNDQLYAATKIDETTSSSEIGLFCDGSCKIYANGNKYNITNSDVSNLSQVSKN